LAGCGGVVSEGQHVVCVHQLRHLECFWEEDGRITYVLDDTPKAEPLP